MQRSVLAYIDGYDPGIFPHDVQERYGIPPERITNLASNENPYPPPQAVVAAMQSALQQVNRYPDPRYRRLKRSLSLYVDKPVENIAVGDGSTEIFDMICKVFLEPFDRIAMISPSYTMYALMGMLRDATVEFVQTKEGGYRVDADFLLKRAGDAKIIFLCSPNNPTGIAIRRDQLRRIVEEAEGIVVLDEAYVDFSDGSATDMVRKHPNLVVTRSMSKFFSLAGLRIGYAIADAEMVENLEKARLPFGISSVAEAAAIASLTCLPYYEGIRSSILEERKRVLGKLMAMKGVHPFPSKANFLMVQIEPPMPELVDKLSRMGILVRDLKGLPGLSGDFLRITIGTQEENDVLLEALKSLLESV